MSGRLQCRASLAPASLSGRSVRAVLHTGRPLRYAAGEACDPYSAHFVRIDLNGVEPVDHVPLLVDHTNEINALAGFVDEIQIFPDRMTGRLNFDESPLGDSLLAKVKSGSLRAVSTGFQPLEVEREADVDGLPSYVARRVRLRETSCTPVGRDERALLMSETLENTAKVAKADPVADIRAAYTAGENLGMVSEVSRLLDSGVPAASVPEALIRMSVEQAQIKAGIQSIHAQRAGVGAGIRAGDLSHEIGEALEARLSGRGNGGRLGGKRVVDLAEACVSAAGFNMSASTPDEILRAAYSPAFKAAGHTSSDFGGILRDAAHKTLLRGYEAAQSPLVKIFRRNDAKDFKPQYVLRFSGSPALLEVKEGGEVLSGTATEQEASWSLKTMGRIFEISRQAMINDDLGAFANFLQAMSVAAAAAEADTLFAVLSANSYGGQTMAYDATALFHANHHNLLNAAAIGVSSVGEAVSALRLQTNLDGARPIHIEPKFLLCGPKVELLARQTVAAVQPVAGRSEVNPFPLEVAVDARFGTELDWYVFADPMTAAVAEYGSLASAPGPQLASQEDFRSLSLAFRCTLDIGAAAVDHRGAARNPGQ